MSDWFQAILDDLKGVDSLAILLEMREGLGRLKEERETLVGLLNRECGVGRDKIRRVLDAIDVLAARARGEGEGT